MTPRTADAHPPRLGLALSGGGLRAALFHIGVLARLAELDLLREIQVLSTVSGGSIVGALYYLHVRNLLQSMPDQAIEPAHYVELVDRLWREFTAAIEHNLRMRAFADAAKNRRMLRDRRYSRSDRMAELYEEYLYAPVAGVTPPARVCLPDLTIAPYGSPNFHPFRPAADGRTGNDTRRNKVPALVINATTLNSGHNFRFTATWMGEPPDAPGDCNLDRNLRLRRAYYSCLPDKYRRLPLGVAVAASAAVPGIFPPLALTDLYRDGAEEVTPQLVDGGVHDNQGLEGLLDPAHPCTHLIVSDASRQMDDVANPLTGIANVVRRSNVALTERLRAEQYAVARVRARHGELRGLIFFHLKEELRQRELTWSGGTDKSGQVRDLDEQTPYGVDARTQDLLADVRTDLDAFSQIESHALMADGYLIARHCVRGETLAAFPDRSPREAHASWEFLDAVPYLEKPGLDPAFTAQLAVASRLFGKTRRIVPASARAPMPVVRAAALVLLALPAVALWWFAGRGLLAALVGLAATGGLRLLARLRGWTRLEDALCRFHAVVPGALIAPLLAWGVARHLEAWTPLRLEYGRLDRLRPPAQLPAGVEREAA